MIEALQAREERSIGPDPWLIRHTAVYQQIDTEKGTCRWILIQPPRLGREGLGHLLQDPSMAQTDTLTLHVITLQSAEMNWRAYLNAIQEQCQTLVCTHNFHESGVDLLTIFTAE